MTGSPPVLRAEGLLCAYGSSGTEPGFTLRVRRLEVGRGEAVALIGPSGCGKTTLLHVLAGLLPPREGTLEADGTALRGPGARAMSDAERRRFRRTRVGLVFQELELLEHLTVRDNLLLAWHLGTPPAPWSTAPERARALAQALEIERYLDRRPRALSQGERQRVAIGRALAPRPPVLLADEPTGNLDPATAARVLDLLLEPVRRDGAALLCVTHDATLLARFDRVVSLPELVRESGGAA